MLWSLKARFPILTRMPPYFVSTQKYIALACSTVHNFIRKQNKEDQLFKEYTDENLMPEFSEKKNAESSSQNSV